MNKRKKEELEKQVFSDFCDNIGININDYHYVDSPDFVNIEHRSAFELTEYHIDSSENGSNLRKIESSLEKIVENAREKYKNKYSDGNSNVFFFPGYRINIATIGKHDTVSCTIADNIYLYNNQNIEIEKHALPNALNKLFNHITIYPKPEYENDYLWQIVRMALLDVNVDAISTIIKIKENKMDLYKKHADAVALLIYSSDIPCVGIPERSEISTCACITNELRNSFFQTIFHSVYFYDRSKNELLKLNKKSIS